MSTNTLLGGNAEILPALQWMSSGWQRFFLLQVMKISVGVVRNRSRLDISRVTVTGSRRIPGYDEGPGAVLGLGRKRAAASAVVG
jgi:hypothetical protein